VRAEAADVLRRVRRHPCLGLICGNNEDYQQVLQWGDVQDLPARVIYEDVLPTLVDSLTRTAPSDGDAGAAGQGDANEDTGAVPYHRGSPYGGKGWDTADPTVGDVHQWDIWAGAMRPWQEYDVRGGRFVRFVFLWILRSMLTHPPASSGSLRCPTDVQSITGSGRRKTTRTSGGHRERSWASTAARAARSVDSACSSVKTSDTPRISRRTSSL
jgi:hypothetical protein